MYMNNSNLVTSNGVLSPEGIKKRDVGTIKPMGGTEILFEKLIKYTDYSKYSNINLIPSICDESVLKKSKANIVWQHQSYDQQVVQNMNSRYFVGSTTAFVYVSNWQYEMFRKVYMKAFQRGYVIKNASERQEYVKRDKKEKIKLIYTSTPWRGLDVLLNAFPVLDRDDIELDIYSSTTLYGSDYYNNFGYKFDPLIEKAKNMKNVNVFDNATNNDVLNALKTANIYVYPSTFEETSCLSMIEAGMSGCEILTTNLGALPETGLGFGTYMPMETDKNALPYKFVKYLDEAINNHWNLKNQELLKLQSERFNDYYAWDVRKDQWNKFFERMSDPRLK